MSGKASSGLARSRWPVCAIAALAICAAAAVPPRPAHAEAGAVRIAHRVERDGGRLVLEFPKPVEYAVERVGNDVYMRFSQALAGDLEPSRRALARHVAELRIAGGGRVLILRLLGQPRLTHYRRGRTVAIVWIGAGANEAAAPAKPPEVKPPASKPSDRQPGENAAPDAKPDEPRAAAKPPEKPAPPKSAEAPPPPKQLDKPAAAPAAPPEPKAAEKPPEKPDKAPPETRRADAAPAKPPANGADPTAPAVGPALAVSSDGAETRIVASWPEPTAAAVFRHGDAVWLVFARRHAFDVAAHQKRLGPGVERLVRHEHAEATVLSARVRPGMTARVTRERNAWTVALHPGAPAAGANDLKLSVARGANEHVGIALAGAETPVRIADPESGAVLFVVPSRAAAAAAGDRRFVTFRVHSALQGAVVEALADGISVAVDGAALVIRRSGGLLISNGPAPGLPLQGQ